MVSDATPVRASGRWTRRVCAGCRALRCMPASEAVCRRCAPAGSPRSWRLRALLEERLEAGLSPEDLAARADVSAATIGRAERGGSVRTETAVAIAGALCTGVLDLAGREQG